MQILCVLLLFWSALGCSYVEIPVHDPEAPNATKYVIGRTNEFGGFGKIDYRIAAYARGEHDAKFGYVALEGELMVLPGNLWAAVDGMNEAGLTLGAQTLRESQYETPGIFEKNVFDGNLVPELLRHCADVEEALKWLSTHRVVGPNAMGTGIHWALADASGRSVVVEYLRGQRVVYENTPRVMTNDPPLDWHWRNLNNYANLNVDFPHQNDFLGVDTEVGKVPRTVSHGLNLAGLPGDGSPPSRYVQLFYLRGYAVKTAPPKTVDDAIVLASGLLNKIFIPLGTFAADRTLGDRLEGPEHTPFGLVKIPAERRLLVRAYRNLRWRQVDLRKLDFTKSYTWPVEDGSLGIDDLTAPGQGGQQLSV